MIRFGHIIISIAFFLIVCGAASPVPAPLLSCESKKGGQPQVQAGVERFPPPDFESGHELPSPTTPHPRQNIYEYIDALVLLAALGLASYLVLKKRSRRAIFVLMVFSLFYFGFWRKGCVCSIGAIQNITLSAFDRLCRADCRCGVFPLAACIYPVFRKDLLCSSMSTGRNPGFGIVAARRSPQLAGKRAAAVRVCLFGGSGSVCRHRECLYNMQV